jgi:hypothetical protein
MFMSDRSAHMTPQKAALDMIILFCDSYPFKVFHLSFNFLWCCSRYLSLWTKSQPMSVLNYKRATAPSTLNRLYGGGVGDRGVGDRGGGAGVGDQ